MIKIVVKLSLLYQKSQFSAKELALGEDLRKKFKQVPGAPLPHLLCHSIDFPHFTLLELDPPLFHFTAYTPHTYTHLSDSTFISL